MENRLFAFRAHNTHFEPGRIDNAVAAMTSWWKNDLALPAASSDLSDAERDLLETLAEPVFSPTAARALAAAHDIELDSPRLNHFLVRAGLFYAFLLGKGIIAPTPPPISPRQFHQMGSIEELIESLIEAHDDDPLEPGH